MADISIPVFGGMFDSTTVVDTVNGFPRGDKAVDASFFAKMISSFYSDGVLSGGDYAQNGFRIVPAGGLAVTVMVLAAEIFFSQLERLILRKSPEMNLYVHYSGVDTMETILNYLREKQIKVLSMQITRFKESTNHTPTAIFLLRLHSKIRRETVLKEMLALDGVISIDDLSC